MKSFGQRLLAEQVAAFEPTTEDLEICRRSLQDTVAVAYAARDHSLAAVIEKESPPFRLAALGHVLDYDDLHLPSTSHLSVVCAMAALAAGGSGDSYLSGAMTMARIGAALGWRHYEIGWHTTCTAGAPAAAVAASTAMGLSPQAMANAIGLSLSGAGGVQRSFGGDGKSIQVGLAVDTGLRAAALAARGARSASGVLDEWLRIHGAQQPELIVGPEHPTQSLAGSLAVKVFPCCYALQRPMVAASELRKSGVCSEEVRSITVYAPEATMKPLIHHRPTSGLEGKFSLEYGVAAALLDEYPGFASFDDRAVERREAQAVAQLVRFAPEPGGDSLLSGRCLLTAELRDGSRREVAIKVPPGAPGGETFPTFFHQKIIDCGLSTMDLSLTSWESARDFVFAELLGATIP